MSKTANKNLNLNVSPSPDPSPDTTQADGSESPVVIESGERQPPPLHSYCRSAEQALCMTQNTDKAMILTKKD